MALAKAISLSSESSDFLSQKDIKSTQGGSNSDIEVLKVTSKEYTKKEMTRSRKIAVAAMLVLSNSLLFLSFGAMMSGSFAIGRTFGLTDPRTTTWLAASLPLTQGAFVLLSGRVGAVYGHRLTLLLGGYAFILFSLINGFCTSIVSFSITRALTGIGSAFVVPNAVAILGITFPPGKARNLSLGLMGMGAPVGGATGAAAIAVAMRWAEWKWFFYIVAILGVIVYGTLWLILPEENPPDPDGSVDWFGGMLGITGLILFNFVWNQAPTCGWDQPYILATLIASLGIFINFALYDHKFARTPIMPLSIWKAPSFTALVIVVLFSVMSYGIVFWYMVAWQQLLRHWSLLSFAAGISPHGIVSALAAPLAAWLVPRVAAQWMLAFGALAILAADLLIATMPVQQSYWLQVFPATVLMALCPDFIFTAAQIIACNSVKKKEQGVAGSLVSLLQLYGASIGLGFGATAELYVAGDAVSKYKGATYLAVALAVVALIVDVLWVRMPRDDREGWAEEEDGPVEFGAMTHRGLSTKVTTPSYPVGAVVTGGSGTK